MTGVAVSPTTFHSRTPSSDRVMLRVRSKIPTANAYVGTAHMRALRPQRSAKGKQMHSLMQLLSQLQRKTPDTVTGMVTIMDITTVMAMGIIMVFTPVVLATEVVTTMVITMETMTALAMAMIKGKVKVIRVLDHRGMSKIVSNLWI